MDFVEFVRTSIVDRWNQFNPSLHTLAHALNAIFYDEDLTAQSNGKRKVPNKHREVAAGVKQSFMRIFPCFPTE